MRVPERNKMIAECAKELQKVHDDYFPRGNPLEDSEWEEVIKVMDGVTSKYTEIPNISGELAMAFLNDIEEYHKKWIKYKKGQT